MKTRQYSIMKTQSYHNLQAFIFVTLHISVLTIIKFSRRVKFRIAFNGHTEGYLSVINSQFVYVAMEVTHKEERGHIRLVGKRQV